jgi:hypothetical protein
LATAQAILANAGAYDREVFVEAYLFVQRQHIQGGEHVRDFYGPRTAPDGGEPEDEA